MILTASQSAGAASGSSSEPCAGSGSAGRLHSRGATNSTTNGTACRHVQPCAYTLNGQTWLNMWSALEVFTER
jgi:hypothetical protein